MVIASIGWFVWWSLGNRGIGFFIIIMLGRGGLFNDFGGDKGGRVLREIDLFMTFSGQLNCCVQPSSFGRND